jgi:hypothetical protein
LLSVRVRAGLVSWAWRLPTSIGRTKLEHGQKTPYTGP